MSPVEAMSAAARDYAVAYTAHYSTRDYAGALRLYGSIIDDHSSSREAGYSKSQIQNIARSLVPADEFLSTLTSIALRQIASPTSQAAPTGSEARSPESAEGTNS